MEGHNWLFNMANMLLMEMYMAVTVYRQINSDLVEKKDVISAPNSTTISKGVKITHDYIGNNIKSAFQLPGVEEAVSAMIGPAAVKFIKYAQKSVQYTVSEEERAVIKRVCEMTFMYPLPGQLEDAIIECLLILLEDKNFIRDLASEDNSSFMEKIKDKL